MKSDNGCASVYISHMTELEIIKTAKEALLMCAPSIEPRSPAGKELKKAVEMINKYLESKQN